MIPIRLCALTTNTGGCRFQNDVFHNIFNFFWWAISSRTIIGNIGKVGNVCTVGNVGNVYNVGDNTEGKDKFQSQLRGALNLPLLLHPFLCSKAPAGICQLLIFPQIANMYFLLFWICHFPVFAQNISTFFGYNSFSKKLPGPCQWLVTHLFKRLMPDVTIAESEIRSPLRQNKQLYLFLFLIIWSHLGGKVWAIFVEPGGIQLVWRVLKWFVRTNFSAGIFWIVWIPEGKNSHRI